MDRTRRRATVADHGARVLPAEWRLIKPDLGRLRLGRITTKRLDEYYAVLSKERGLPPPPTVAVLDAQRRRLDAQRRRARSSSIPTGYVFTESADGADPLHPDTITKRFTRVRKQAGLDGVRLHDLRHLHATQLLAAGVPVRTVSGRLGHANATTTLNVYAHFLEASDRQAADVIADLLG